MDLWWCLRRVVQRVVPRGGVPPIPGPAGAWFLLICAVQVRTETVQRGVVVVGTGVSVSPETGSYKKNLPYLSNG